MNLSLTTEQVEALLATLFESRPGSAPHALFRNGLSLSRQQGPGFAISGNASYDMSTGYHQQDENEAQLPTIVHRESDVTIKQRSPEDEAPHLDHMTNNNAEGEKKFVRKRPGPKPSTREPATKRRAQNRAAQRAYRERKEVHIKELEEANDSLRAALESVKKENSALRTELLKAGLELRVRNNGELPSTKSELSVSPSAVQQGEGGNEKSPSITATSPISPQVSTGMHRMSSTATSSEASQASLPSAWASKLSLDHHNPSPRSSHRQNYALLTSSRVPHEPSRNSEISHYGDSSFSMVHASGPSNPYSFRSHDTVGQLETNHSLSSLYVSRDSDRHNSIASTNASSAASRSQWSSISTFNHPAETARYSPGIFLQQFHSAPQTQTGNSFAQMHCGINPLLTENSIDWYFGHHGEQMDENMFADYHEGQEGIEFAEDFYESNHSESAREEKHQFSGDVIEIDRKDNVLRGEKLTNSSESKGLANASHQIWDKLWSKWHITEYKNDDHVLETLCIQLATRARC